MILKDAPGSQESLLEESVQLPAFYSTTFSLASLAGDLTDFRLPPVTVSKCKYRAGAFPVAWLTAIGST